MREWVSRGEVRTVVPSHGPVHTGTHGIDKAWTGCSGWRSAWKAASGLGLSERLRLPDRFAKGAGQAAEFVRNVMGLYPAHKLAQLQGRSVPTGTAR